jgi:hypothetical protein
VATESLSLAMFVRPERKKLVVPPASDKRKVKKKKKKLTEEELMRKVYVEARRALGIAPKRKRPTRLKRAILLEKAEKARLAGDVKEDEEGGEGEEKEEGQEEEEEEGVMLAVAETEAAPRPASPPLRAPDPLNRLSASAAPFLPSWLVAPAGAPAAAPQPAKPVLPPSAPPGVVPREYCDQIVSDDLTHEINLFLAELYRLDQLGLEKARSNPGKAAKRRYVCGLKEASKHAAVGDVKCLILAPNIDDIQTEGALNSMVNSLIDQVRGSGAPVIFGPTMQRLGRPLHVHRKISAVAILFIDPLHDVFRKLVAKASEARDAWHSRNPNLPSEPRAKVKGPPAATAPQQEAN